MTVDDLGFGAPWRVTVAGRDPVPFYTERGARTHAAIIAGPDPRGARPRVEHRHEDEWHDCPAGLAATIGPDQLEHELHHRGRPDPITSRPARPRRSDAVSD